MANDNNHIVENGALYINGKGKRVRMEQYQDMLARLFPSEVEKPGEKILSRTVTFQVTDACNLACSYCYQINKGKRRLKFEDAKKLIDMLLDGDEKISKYINTENSPGIIIEFIGGEPFLEIELIDQIVDYFKIQAAIRKHPWATRHCISICSNGVLYFNPKVQEFLNKNRSNMSFSITIDGNKELHDACRVFPDGRPSYDLAVTAAKDWISKGNYMGSKITIAPGNIQHLYSAITHMVELGYTEINANVVYEKGWELEHAKIYYDQLKKIADYWSEKDIVETVYLSLFEENFFRPKIESDNDNWCFRAGTLILTSEGEIPIEEIKIGDEVIGADGEYHKVINVMKRMSNNTASIQAKGMKKTYTTKDHPYLVRCKSDNNEYKDPKWVKISDIKYGDLILLYKEHEMIWTDVVKITDEEPYEVYNITVDEVHSYIANGAVVHNCGGTGYMLSIDPDGRLFPCIRYMESSLGDDAEPYYIGDVNNGIGYDKITEDRIECLNCINRRSQSTDECFYCPIADGCSWCSAYNYQEFGTPNSRATYICIMHKARSLANVYFWNKYYKEKNMNKVFKLWCPDEWALDIISQDELDMLKDMSKPYNEQTVIVNDNRPDDYDK